MASSTQLQLLENPSDKDRLLETVNSILDESTDEKFDEVISMLIDHEIETPDTLREIVGLIYDKAVSEPTLCPKYALLCSQLNDKLPPVSSGGKGITFKQVIVSMCQEVFECADKVRGEVRQLSSMIEHFKKEQLSKVLFFGNICLFGELWKQRMLTDQTIHEVIQKLLMHDGKPCPDEENVEALCQFFKTFGKHLDEKSPQTSDVHFSKLKDLMINPQLNLPLRLMILDVIDLRAEKWAPRPAEKNENEESEWDWEEEETASESEDSDYTREEEATSESEESDYEDKNSDDDGLEIAARKESVFDKGHVLKMVESIVNKSTQKNFDEVKQILSDLEIITPSILKGIVELIYDKAVFEPTISARCVLLCSELNAMLPPILCDELGGKEITVKKILLNMCQEVFEGTDNVSAEIRQITSVIEHFNKKKMATVLFHGNIRLIGELWKQGMLADRIVNFVIQKLLMHDGKPSPEEENMEALCHFLMTFGKHLDERSRRITDVYFSKLKDLMINPQLDLPLRLMIRDVIDLRAKNWEQDGEEENEFDWEESTSKSEESDTSEDSVDDDINVKGCGNGQDGEEESEFDWEESASKSEQRDTSKDSDDDDDINVKGCGNGVTDLPQDPFLNVPPVDSTQGLTSLTSNSDACPIPQPPSISISNQVVSKVNVRGYMVPSSDVLVLEKIFDKHGDFMAGCFLKSPLFINYALEAVVKITQELLLHSARSTPDLEAVRLVLEDLENNGVQVNWLKACLERAAHCVKCTEAEKRLEEINKQMTELATERHAVSAALEASRAFLPAGFNPNEPLGAGLF